LVEVELVELVGIMPALVPEESEEPVWLVDKLVAVTVVPVVPLVPDVDEASVILYNSDSARIAPRLSGFTNLRMKPEPVGNVPSGGGSWVDPVVPSTFAAKV